MNVNGSLVGMLVAAGLAPAAQAGGWNVTEISGLEMAAEAVVTLSTDGGIHVDTGCNLLRMNGRLENGAIVVDGPVAATRMACPGGLAAQESALEKVFQSGPSVAYDPFQDLLTLRSEDVTVTLVASKADGGTSPDPWQTHAGRERPSGTPPYLGVFGLADDLPIRAEPVESSEIRDGVPSGTILRNGGCADGWCVVETIDGNVTGWALSVNLEPASDALRAGQGIYDATGILSCTVGPDAGPDDCLFGVARGAEGAATVVIQRPDGLKRALFFQGGQFVSTDASQAAGGFDTAVSRTGDTTTVRFDSETYEIPDATLFGG